MFLSHAGGRAFCLFINALVVGHNAYSIGNNYRFFRKKFAGRAECVPTLLFF